MVEPRFEDRVQSWVAAGLIDDSQAAAIVAHESHDESTLPRWVEPISYLGAALVVVALIILGAEVWDRIEPWGRATITAIAALVLAITGAALLRSETAPAQRGGHVAWLGALATLAGLVGILTTEYTGLPDRAIPFTVASLSTVAGVALWIASRSAVQHVGMAVAAAFMVGSVADMLPLAPGWMVGLLLAGLGTTWLLLTWAGVLVPEGVGWVVGALLTASVGFAGFGDRTGWLVAGVAVGLGLVWLATRLDRRSVLAIGVAALLVWIPATVTDVFSGTVAVPLAILVTGVVTLGVVVVAVRGGRRPTGDGPDA